MSKISANANTITKIHFCLLTQLSFHLIYDLFLVFKISLLITMSLAETVKVVEQQLSRSDQYLFKEVKQQLLQHAQPNHPLVTTIDVLIAETWSSYRQKQLKIDRQYENKLKLLTILTSFFGATTYSLPKLMGQLQSTREQTLNLLVEASIFKLISVKIDEQANLIHILHAKLRECDSEGSLKPYLNGKIAKIEQNNAKVKILLQDVAQSKSKRKERQQISWRYSRAYGR